MSPLMLTSMMGHRWAVYQEGRDCPGWKPLPPREGRGGGTSELKVHLHALCVEATSPDGVGGGHKMKDRVPPAPTSWTQIHTLFEQLRPEDTTC